MTLELKAGTRVRLWEGVSDGGTRIQMIGLVSAADADGSADAFEAEFGELLRLEPPTIEGVELLQDLVLLSFDAETRERQSS